jgi:DNA-binding winged helix-turn-helix (wHTH) protein/cytochrome c-type biogenesis protein CcmH/NrfG
MPTREIFHFGGFTLDVGEHRLSAGLGAVRLAPKAFDVLVALVRQRGRLITKHELLAQVWPESFVEEGILSVHVAALRKALGDDTRPPAYIETVARTGYRFISAVTCDSPDERSALAGLARPVELYEYVGRGRSHLLSGSYFELPGAVDAFRAALAIDPTYAPAHAGLARARCAQAGLRAVPHQEAFSEAKASALRALAMDSNSADAQVALGSVLFLSEWDWPAAERSLRRALEINPDYTEALLQYGSLQEALGRLDEGLRFKQQALARDPRSTLVLMQIAVSYWHQRKYEETLAWARRVIEIDPKHLLAGEFISSVCWKLGDINGFAEANLRQATVFGCPDEALAHLKQVIEPMQDAFATAGLAGVNRYMADQLTNERLEFDAILKMAFRRAVVYGAAGRLDEAFECLDQAIAFRDPALVHLAVAPQWDGLRGDSRFGERLKVMGLPLVA